MKNNGIPEPRFMPLAFLPVAFVFLLVYSFSTSPLYLYEGFDSATFRTIGLGIIQGKLPYADLFDHKGPLIFYIDALGQWLIPGKWGIFLLQVLSLALSMYIIYRICRLFADVRISFVSTVLLLFPLIDFIVEGNQCEEWMLPYISLSLYLALSWLFDGGDRSHHLWRSLVYGLCFSVVFFIRPNDAVASIGAIMLGIFVYLVLKKRYVNAVANALAFLGGCLLGALPVFGYFAYEGILQDMLYGTVLYNIEYSEGVTLKTLGVGIVLIPIIIVGACIYLSRRNASISRINYILIPYLVLTLIFIGKRDYYHYLLPLLPYVSLFFTLCLRRSLRAVVATVCILFLAGSFYQQKQLVKIVTGRDYLENVYSQIDRMFHAVPEKDRNSVWNFNLYSTFEDRPRVCSLHGAFLHAGVTPGNRIFIRLHIDKFGEEERIESNAPEWVIRFVDGSENRGTEFIDSNYTLVAQTDRSCGFEVGLYRRNAAEAGTDDFKAAEN